MQVEIAKTTQFPLLCLCTVVVVIRKCCHKVVFVMLAVESLCVPVPAVRMLHRAGRSSCATRACFASSRHVFWEEIIALQTFSLVCLIFSYIDSCRPKTTSYRPSAPPRQWGRTRGRGSWQKARKPGTSSSGTRLRKPLSKPFRERGSASDEAPTMRLLEQHRTAHLVRVLNLVGQPAKY